MGALEGPNILVLKITYSAILLGSFTGLGNAADKPLFHALVTSGWNEKTPVEFSVERDRRFVWRSGNAVRTGLIEPAALSALILHVAAAKPGPRANDVGTLQVTWRDGTGKQFHKVFYFPGQAPASGLVQEIEAVSKVHPDR